VGVYFGELQDLVTKLAMHSEGVNDLLDNPARSSNSNVFVAAGTVLVELKPVLNAPFAKELVAVVTLFGFATYLEADLAQNKPSELFVYLEPSDAVGVVAYVPHL
jgi:hypothetical protein